MTLAGDVVDRYLAVLQAEDEIANLRRRRKRLRAVEAPALHARAPARQDH